MKGVSQPEGWPTDCMGMHLEDTATVQSVSGTGVRITDPELVALGLLLRCGPGFADAMRGALEELAATDPDPDPDIVDRWRPSSVAEAIAALQRERERRLHEAEEVSS